MSPQKHSRGSKIFMGFIVAVAIGVSVWTDLHPLPAQDKRIGILMWALAIVMIVLVHYLDIVWRLRREKEQLRHALRLLPDIMREAFLLAANEPWKLPVDVSTDTFLITWQKLLDMYNIEALLGYLQSGDFPFELNYDANPFAAERLDIKLRTLTTLTS